MSWIRIPLVFVILIRLIITQMLPNIIQDRKNYSDEIMSKLKEKILNIEELKQYKDLCIYVTGSFARLEASEHSDLDIFFINAAQKKGSISKISKTLIDAQLIEICRELGFPEFSNDGEFLKIHELCDMKEKLGSPADDFDNLFTARLLLLLESRPLYNEKIYKRLIKEIVESYFRDYHDHEADFKPIFLVNDLIRFWKTLCLNYEHRRNRRNLQSGKDLPDEVKSKNHLKNLKLKFSRLLTCFSMIIFLSKNRSVINPEDVINEVAFTPLDRLQKIFDHVELETLQKVYYEYAWFLETTGKPASQVINWISIRENRDEAFNHARVFGQTIYQLLQSTTTDTSTMRYLVI